MQSSIDENTLHELLGRAIGDGRRLALMGTFSVS
jgi:hypothetical protein